MLLALPGISSARCRPASACRGHQISNPIGDVQPGALQQTDPLHPRHRLPADRAEHLWTPVPAPSVCCRPGGTDGGTSSIPPRSVLRQDLDTDGTDRQKISVLPHSCSADERNAALTHSAAAEEQMRRGG